MGWFEKLMLRLFPYFDITRDENGAKEIYLRRWFLYPRNKEFKKMEPRLYLHKFYHGDDDPHPHDHPWKFTSLILTKGYWEETPMEQPLDTEALSTREIRYRTSEETGEKFRQVFYPVGTLLHRPAAWKHRVILDLDKNGKPKQAWTIVLTGVKERSWGFWIEKKMCPWRNYTDGVCWCDSNEDATTRPKVSFHA